MSEVKNQFKDFVIEEIIPELLSSTGYTYEELMEENVQLEELEEPEIFNNEIMNNYKLTFEDNTFECYLDQELIENAGEKSMKFRELMELLES